MKKALITIALAVLFACFSKSYGQSLSVYGEYQDCPFHCRTIRINADSITWDKKTPDLITANAAFEANGRLYHVIAGIAKTDKMGQLTAIARAKQKLEKFLNGVELLKPQK